MSFIDAATEAGFAALLTYAAIAVLAHLFKWRKFSRLSARGPHPGHGLRAPDGCRWT